MLPQFLIKLFFVLNVIWIKHVSAFEQSADDRILFWVLYGFFLSLATIGLCAIITLIFCYFWYKNKRLLLEKYTLSPTLSKKSNSLS
uniref:Uncharacterized protein n=1 Tax=Panagrolaimus sp. JU765 TaxID=591449 RepID=A0AC34RAK7_9BILA